MIEFNDTVRYLLTSLTLALYSITTYFYLNFSDFINFTICIAFHTLWAYYVSGINLYTSSCFNIICLNLSHRYEQIYNSLEALVKSKSDSQIGQSLNAISELLSKYDRIYDTFDALNKSWNWIFFFNNLCCLTYGCYVFHTIITAKFDLILFIFNVPIIFQAFYFLRFKRRSISAVTKSVSKK
jgi:hypothetical protein